MLIYNFISTLVLALIVLIALCALVLRIFNRHKLVNKYFDGIEETLYIFSFVNIVCIILDITMDNDPSKFTLCGTLIINYVGISVVVLLCFMVWFGFGKTKKIRSKFKDY